MSRIHIVLLATRTSCYKALAAFTSLTHNYLSRRSAAEEQ